MRRIQYFHRSFDGRLHLIWPLY